MGQSQTVKCICGISFTKYFKDATRIRESNEDKFFWMCSNCGQGYTEAIPANIPIPEVNVDSVQII